MYNTILRVFVAISFAIGALPLLPVSADTIEEPAFQRTWARTDRPVAEGRVHRTWMWGPDVITEAFEEPYRDAPGGERLVQYTDKSRMEDNSYRASPPWDVTNGLIAKELITGELQTGDETFQQHDPATVHVAGDPHSDTPTYATFSGVLDDAPLPTGNDITQTIDQRGDIANDDGLAEHGVTAGYFVPQTSHAVASVFWNFMNDAGAVYEDGQFVQASLFENPFYAVGFPITEAYWTDVPVKGEWQDVLVQCFERRCLTYTPGNADGWKVEAGNVGLHYYDWRYQMLQEPGDPPPPVDDDDSPPPSTGDPSPTPEPDPDPTPTPEPDPTPTPNPEPTPTPEPDPTPTPEPDPTPTPTPSPTPTPTPTPEPTPTPTPPPDEEFDELNVYYFDVGQADATLFKGPDFNILIDTGEAEASDVRPHLESVGVSELDLMIITHPHPDHIGQAAEILENMPVDEVWMSGFEGFYESYSDAMGAVESTGVDYHEPRAGGTDTYGSAMIEVFNPVGEPQHLHDNIVVRITYGDVRFLFTGDAETEHELEIVNREDDLRAEIFHVGRHGDESANTDELLDAVSPEVAIYSATEGNPYGRPHPDVVNRILNRGIDLYGTDVHGTVRVETDGESYSVHPDREGEITP